MKRWELRYQYQIHLKRQTPSRRYGGQSRSNYSRGGFSRGGQGRDSRDNRGGGRKKIQ